MALKKYKPTTPGQRFKVISSYDELTASIPEKSLLTPIRKTGGRNNEGKMTMRYLGGGHKQMYRMVDFKRDKEGIPAVVKTIVYDPNRSARIAPASTTIMPAQAKPPPIVFLFRALFVAGLL